ncbi:hypothetical protein HYU12_00030 [Candidatus Woesearchaeota archaeon]|nr:hypothetical protein [Candidatus Woesearchaeota archaeon]
MAALMTEKDWKRHIRRLRAEANPPMTDKAEIKKQLKKAIREAIQKRMPKERFGVMLSGGVDSSLISLVCRQLNSDFICYTVGTKGSKDLKEAKKAAKKLRLKLRWKEFEIKEAEAIIKKAVKIIGEANPVNAGVAAVEIAAIQLAAKERIRNFLGGLGSEEIFAGYQRHEKASDINEECWNGLKEMHARDLVRDSKVAKAMKANLIAPFLDTAVIKLAMRIPARYKISGETKKLILREAAAEMGLPKETAFRKKTAAQYGSGIDKAMERIAKEKGFSNKSSYLKSLL